MAFTFEFPTPELFLSGKKKLDSCWISPTSEHQEEVHKHLSCCCHRGALYPIQRALLQREMKELPQ